MSKRLLFILLFLQNGIISVSAQDSLTSVLTFDTYYQLVLENHPVVSQANLLPEQAKQQLRLARGSFDPKLEGSWEYKDLNDTEYFNLLDVSLKIPTWFPVNPKVGFERNRGEFLNPENFISEKTGNEQIYAGISVPLGRGLFIDNRRAVVRQATIFQDMAEAEQIKAINKILLTATKDYWEWYNAYENYRLMLQSIGIAEDIFNRTQQAFIYGEAAMIDTVQAKITLQKRIIDYEQAKIERLEAALELSNHLWTEEGRPLELQENVVPERFVQITLDEGLLQELYLAARDNHPELLKLRLKINSLQIDQSLARENFKPQIDVSYTILDQPFTPNGETTDITFRDNFKVGVDFSFPVFLRKERAKLRQTEFKILDSEYELDFSERRIINNINARYNIVLTTINLIREQSGMVRNYELIVNAERLNLLQGESDLFKLNAQLDKLIESQTKLFKLRSQFKKDVAELYWIAGIRNLGNL
ncbi:MAG: TolC family protein [Cyclobacteriaceae bacterium]